LAREFEIDGNVGLILAFTNSLSFAGIISRVGRHGVFLMKS
jgi:hypothetical protein